MKLLNPAGLWLLLGIPVLIVIYIIRSRYEEKTVSGTYLWQLSRRFQKRRLPLQKWMKMLLFLLQIFCIVLSAVLLSRPARVLSDRCDYIAILDASASMQTENEKGVSRFDRAKKEIATLSRQTRKGHTLSVILMGKEAESLVTFSASESEVKLALAKAGCETGECSPTDAVALAESLCTQSRNAKVLLYTDTRFEKTENIELVSVNTGEENAWMKELVHRSVVGGSEFSATLESQTLTGSVTVALKLDGVVVDSAEVQCRAGEESQVPFFVPDVTEFDVAEVFLETKDALLLDNSFSLLPEKVQKCKTLVVSKRPLYLQKALDAVGCRVKVAGKIPDTLAGYDLLVFDAIFPETMPQGVSVIQFGTDHLPEGVSVGGEYTRPCALEAAPDCPLDWVKEMSLKDVQVSRYTALQPRLGWESLLVCGKNSVALDQSFEDGTFHTVFSFDVHDSNLPLKRDFIALLYALVRRAAPGLVEESVVDAGGVVELHIPAGAKKIVLENPRGELEEIDTSHARFSYTPEERGVYTVLMETEEGAEAHRFFVRTPIKEAVTEDDTPLSVHPKSSPAVEDETLSEVRVWVALAAFLLILLEWGWYYRDRI